MILLLWLVLAWLLSFFFFLVSLELVERQIGGRISSSKPDEPLVMSPSWWVPRDEPLVMSPSWWAPRLVLSLSAEKSFPILSRDPWEITRPWSDSEKVETFYTERHRLESILRVNVPYCSCLDLNRVWRRNSQVAHVQDSIAALHTVHVQDSVTAEVTAG